MLVAYACVVMTAFAFISPFLIPRPGKKAPWYTYLLYGVCFVVVPYVLLYIAASIPAIVRFILANLP